MVHMTEHLTPQEQIDNGPARDLANQANIVFDERQDAALKLAKLSVDPIAPIAPPDLLQVEGDVRKTFLAADEKFNTYVRATNVLMPSRDAFEATEPEPKEPFASPEVWAAMSKQERAFNFKAREAMAEGPLKEFGVTKESLRVLRVEIDGKNRFVLVHTGKGVDVGDPEKQYDPDRSPRAVLSSENDELFKFKVGGKEYDGRSGMVDEVYDAKVEDARARGVILPDSQQLSKKTKDDWTATILTGEEGLPVGIVPIRNVRDDGQVDRYVIFPDRGYRYLRVCPAVVTPDFADLTS